MSDYAVDYKTPLQQFYYPNAVRRIYAVDTSYPHYVCAYSAAINHTSDLMFANAITGLIQMVRTNARLPLDVIHIIKSFVPDRHLRSIDRRHNLEYGGQPCQYVTNCRSKRLGVTRYCEHSSGFDMKDMPAPELPRTDLELRWGNCYVCFACERALRGQVDLIYHRLRYRIEETLERRCHLMGKRAIERYERGPDFTILGQCLKCNSQIWLYDPKSRQYYCANCWCMARMNDHMQLPGVQESLRKRKARPPVVIDLTEDY